MTTRGELVERMNAIKAECLEMTETDWDEPMIFSTNLGRMLGMILVVADGVIVLANEDAPLPHVSSRAVQALLREMTSITECAYDHNGYCQVHYRPDPCVHARARELLGIEVER